MSLNLGGGKWQRTKFFFKKFLEGGENDKGGKMTEGITVYFFIYWKYYYNLL